MENKRSEQLLKKYLSGQCTPEEQAIVESWYYDVSGKQKDALPEPDYLSMKQDVLNAIRKDKNQRQVKIKTTWLRIAAAIIMICSIGIGSYYYFQTDNKKFKTAQYTKKITAGGNKAILTLANGKKISLTDARDGELAVQSGVKISKTAGGQLIYDVSNVQSKSSKPEFNKIETPVGGQYRINLPDGTQVWLNAASSLKYPTVFSDQERRVEVTGEAYFEVAHNKAKPFRVTTGTQLIEVLGTHFNVTAYPDEKTIKTTLLQGSVKITGHGQTKQLVPGEQSQVTAQNITVTNHIDMEDVIAWKNGYFKFNENIEGIMSKISRWYNVEVVYQIKSNPKMLFAGEIERSKDLSDVLQIIELTGNVHFKIQGRRITVMP